MSKMRIRASKSVNRTTSKRKVYSAEDYDLDDYELDDYMDSTDVSEEINKLQDSVENLQDSVDQIEEDEVDIDIDNNIADHLVAECEKCKGVFISAMIESDQQISKISGICPLCNEETDQYTKWVIKEV